MSPMIQLANPAREHESLREPIEAAVVRVLRAGQYILGPEVEAFEREFAAYCGAGAAVAVSNGSDAIVVALQALGVGPGDEVVTSAFSYLATASAIARTGATPVFADIDLESFNLDPRDVARRITPRTRAILAVHLFGRAAEMPALAALAREANVALVEDAAQACGAEQGGVRTGALGVIGCFSFFPAKPFGTAGDGGACTTSDPALATRMKQVRVTGATAKNVHDLPGGNYRLDPVHAAILRTKLPHLEARLERRRSHAAALRRVLHGASAQLALPAEPADGRHVYAQFTVRHPRRDALSVALKARGVGSEVYYPMPMPYQKVFAALGHRAGDFPTAERACREVLSIPVHSELTEVELAQVGEALRSAVADVEAAS